MVSSVDIFYLCLGFGFVVLTGFASYALYQAAITIKKFQQIVDNVAETTQDITDLKNNIKRGVLKFVLDIVSKKFKGGDN